LDVGFKFSNLIGKDWLQSVGYPTKWEAVSFLAFVKEFSRHTTIFTTASNASAKQKKVGGRLGQ
jgi:hypothetical protein